MSTFVSTTVQVIATTFELDETFSYISETAIPDDNLLSPAATGTASNCNTPLPSSGIKPENVPLPLTPVVEAPIEYQYDNASVSHSAKDVEDHIADIMSDPEDSDSELISVPGTPVLEASAALSYYNGSEPHPITELVEASTPLSVEEAFPNYSAVGEEVFEVYEAFAEVPETLAPPPTPMSVLDAEAKPAASRIGPPTAEEFVPEIKRLQPMFEKIPEAYEEYLEMKEMQKKVVQIFGPSAMVPQDFGEWLEFRRGREEDRQVEVAEALANHEKNKDKSFPRAFNGKKFKYPGSSVLGYATMWSDRANPAGVTNARKRVGATVWPTQGECIWEGDDRAASGYGRFPPLVRDRSKRNRFRAWSKLPLVPMHQFDEIRKVPTLFEISDSYEFTFKCN